MPEQERKWHAISESKRAPFTGSYVPVRNSKQHTSYNTRFLYVYKRKLRDVLSINYQDYYNFVTA
jgi:hypothetical protein